MDFVSKKIAHIKASLDVHTIEVVRKTSASLIVKVLGMIVGLVVSIILGHKLGAEGLGIIDLANRTVGILLVIVMLGMEQVLLKEVAIGFSKKDWIHINSVVSTGIKVNGLLGFVIIVVTLLCVPFLVSNVFKEPTLKVPLIIAVCAMLPQIFSRIFASSLNGCKKIWQSNLVNETLSTWVVGAVLLIWMTLGFPVTVVEVAWFYAIGRLLVTLTMLLYWFTLRVKTRTKFLGKYLTKTSLPLLVVNATFIITASLDTVMLGWLSNVREVGLYNVAARLALLTSFFLQISNSAVSPKLASLFVEHKLEEMKVMVHRVTKGLIIIAGVSLLGFVLFGKIILSIWGKEFIDAYAILLILSIGQFVNISTGPAGYLLIMCGKEKIHGRVSIISLICNICLNGILIIYWGAKGAAVATSFTVIIENYLKWFYAKKYIGISTIFFNKHKNES